MKSTKKTLITTLVTKRAVVNPANNNKKVPTFVYSAPTD